MPSPRISKGFKDLSMSLEVNPINLDLITIKNETAIARSLRNLVFTTPGERFFDPNLGSRVKESLFENIDDQTAAAIKEEIITTLFRIINKHRHGIILILIFKMIFCFDFLYIGVNFFVN